MDTTMVRIVIFDHMEDSVEFAIPSCLLRTGSAVFDHWISLMDTYNESLLCTESHYNITRNPRTRHTWYAQRSKFLLFGDVSSRDSRSRDAKKEYLIHLFLRPDLGFGLSPKTISFLLNFIQLTSLSLYTREELRLLSSRSKTIKECLGRMVSLPEIPVELASILLFLARDCRLTFSHLLQFQCFRSLERHSGKRLSWLPDVEKSDIVYYRNSDPMSALAGDVDFTRTMWAMVDTRSCFRDWLISVSISEDGKMVQGDRVDAPMYLLFSGFDSRTGLLAAIVGHIGGPAFIVGNKIPNGPLLVTTLFRSSEWDLETLNHTIQVLSESFSLN